MEKEIKKQIYSKSIFRRIKSLSRFCETKNFTWGEVKKILQENNIELQDTDILEIQYVEGWDEGDSSRDSCYEINVIRFTEETDEQFEQRKIKIQKRKQEEAEKIEKQEREQLRILKEKYE